MLNKPNAYTAISACQFQTSEVSNGALGLKGLF